MSFYMGEKDVFLPVALHLIFVRGPPVFYSAKCLLIVCGDMWAGMDKSFFNSSFSSAGGLWIDNANHHFGSPLFFPSSVFPNISGSHDSTRKKEDNKKEVKEPVHNCVYWKIHGTWSDTISKMLHLDLSVITAYIEQVRNNKNNLFPPPTLARERK